MSTPATPAPAAADHRVILLEELYQRYGKDAGAAGGLWRRLRFWRKKYAWVLIVGGAKAVKRAIDITAALTLLILGLPGFALVALCIKLTDGGPVLFWQTRVGRWGREIPFPKFRSMVINAEEIKHRMLAVQKLSPEERNREFERTDLDATSRKILKAMKNDHLVRLEQQFAEFLARHNGQPGLEETHAFLESIRQTVPKENLRDFYAGGRLDAVKLKEYLTLTFKQKDDPRVTWIGRIIRKLSIDELPQLWCVLKGDMSLVGPRPPVPREVARYTLADRRRLDATPGLTCIWQVSGRGDIPFHQQVKLDVDYINSQSLWLDIKLLFMTVPAVLLGKGAY